MAMAAMPIRIVFRSVERRAQSLLSLGNWIALIHPIGAEIVSDVEHLDVGEAHGAQRIVGRLDVRTMTPGATATINHDELFSGKRLNARAQLLAADLAGTRTDVLGTGNMCLLVQNVGANLDQQRLFPLRGLKDLDEFFRIDRPGSRYQGCLKSKDAGNQYQQ